MLRIWNDRLSDHGQTLVIFAIFLVVLLGAAAITIDYGSWLKAKRDYQNVVDAAVLQGAAYLTRPMDPSKQTAAREAAWASIEQSLGLPLDETALASAGNTPPTPGVQVGDYRVWVRTPPIADAKYAGAYANSNRVIYASIEKFNAAFFSRIFGQGERSVQAWASAGTFPNRFALITLRRRSEGMGGGNPQDIDIQGGTHVRIVDGDVGGNWGMAIGGGPGDTWLKFESTTGDQYGAYLAECCPPTVPFTTGNGWVAGQVIDSASNPVPVQFHPEVADPNYPAPCLTYGVGPGNGCLEDRSALPLSGGSNLLSTTPDRVGDSCPAGSTAARLPAGRYHDVRVPADKCIVLDPDYLAVNGKSNGIFLFTGQLDLRARSLVIGDGVTIVFDRGAGDLAMVADATMVLNTGNITNNPDAAGCGGVPGGGSTPCRFAAWAAKSQASSGTHTWSSGPLPTFTAPADPFERGIVTYVCRSALPNCTGPASPSSSILQMEAGAGIEYRGLVYAPLDNVTLSGQPGHQNVGQLVSYTVKFTGSSEISQTYDGPDSAFPQLLEPRVGQ